MIDPVDRWAILSVCSMFIFAQTALSMVWLMVVMEHEDVPLRRYIPSLLFGSQFLLVSFILAFLVQVVVALVRDASANEFEIYVEDLGVKLYRWIWREGA